MNIQRAQECLIADWPPMNLGIGDGIANENLVIVRDEETEWRCGDIHSSAGWKTDGIPDENLSLSRMREIHRVILIDEQRIRNVANDRTVCNDVSIRIPGGVQGKFWLVEGAHLETGQDKQTPC